jgi:hypothetical protein
METPEQAIVVGRHACTIGLKSLFKVVYDRSPEAEEARKILEGGKTRYQCRGVIPEKRGCWLCGYLFSPRDESYFLPQCEHVLPIAQGIIFLQLYTRKYGKDKESDAVRLEYEYAHAICNQLKGDTVLMRETPAGEFEPDGVKIDALLGAISSRIGRPISKAQVSNVFARMKSVTDYVNSLPDFTINLNLSVCPKKLVFKSIGGGKTFRRKYNGLSKGSRGKSAVRRNSTNSKPHRRRQTADKRRSN